MGVVVTVMNMKGGVGKTTVTMHLAGIAANYGTGAPTGAGPRVLAIDYDPQFNLSQAFLPAKTYFSLEQARKTTIAILLDDDTDINPFQLQVPGKHTPPEVSSLTTNLYKNEHYGRCLDLIPSTLDLMYLALGQSSQSTAPIEERFAKFIAECKNLYDITFIDCHPAGSLFTKTSLRNSDHVLIPVAPQQYAIRGIGLMMEFISAGKQGLAGPTPHILFNAVPRSGTSAEETQIRANPRFGKFCMTHTLKWYQAFADPQAGEEFVWMSSKPYSTQAFFNALAVTREFIGRI
jgi:chromosome partitioning protein